MVISPAERLQAHFPTNQTQSDSPPQTKDRLIEAEDPFSLEKPKTSKGLNIEYLNADTDPEQGR